jgi:glycosyltransferase involved in cell wall biosynthesis
MNDDVTVAITCFNYGAFLPGAVQSALGQAGGPPRVIVVDDGSTDQRTLAELERLPPEVDLVRQENAGVASARNAALERIRTPFALVLDADDLLTPTSLALLREPLDADRSLGFSYGQMRFFGEWEGLLRMPPYDPYRLLYRHTIGATALMRREMVEDVAGFDSEFVGYEDWEYWVHALARGWRGRRVEEVTVLYRRHGPSRHLEGRALYRDAFRELRRKHARLYGRAGRRRIAEESDLNAFGRLVYRWWWGWRPLPARLELLLQSMLWRPERPLGTRRHR